MNKDVAKSHKQLDLFDIEKKIQQSTSTIAEIRVPIFLPVAKLSGRSKIAMEFKKNKNKIVHMTSWGKVEIRGRRLLTIVHKDIMDCIASYNEKTEKLSNNKIYIYFYLTRIAKEYGRKYANKNTDWVKERIEEIRDTTINYERTNGDSFDFNMISSLTYLDEKKMYRMEVDEKFALFYETELSINYKKNLPALLEIDNPLVKTIIRWFFTHKKQQTFKLETIFSAIGMPVDSMSVRMFQLHKKELINEVETMRKFGIDYNPKEATFFYSGNENVAFIPALTAEQRLQVADKNYDEFINQVIEISEKKYTINEIKIIVEDDVIHCRIEVAEEDVPLKYNNKNNNTELIFKNEVYEWIKSKVFKTAAIK